MASITGTVASIEAMPYAQGFTSPLTAAKVVVVEQGTTTRETFTLWYEGAAFVASSDTPRWIARISALSLLRDALLNKRTVTITTASPTSSLIEAVLVA